MTTHSRSEWGKRTKDYHCRRRPSVATACHLAEMPHLARAGQSITTPNYHSAGRVLPAFHYAFQPECLSFRTCEVPAFSCPPRAVGFLSQLGRSPADDVGAQRLAWPLEVAAEVVKLPRLTRNVLYQSRACNGRSQCATDIYTVLTRAGTVDRDSTGEEGQPQPLRVEQ